MSKSVLYMELMIKNGTYVKLVRDSYPPASDYIHFPRSRFYALLGANLEERYEKYPNYLDFVYPIYTQPKIRLQKIKKLLSKI